MVVGVPTLLEMAGPTIVRRSVRLDTLSINIDHHFSGPVKVGPEAVVDVLRDFAHARAAVR